MIYLVLFVGWFLFVYLVILAVSFPYLLPMYFVVAHNMLRLVIFVEDLKLTIVELNKCFDILHFL